MIRGLMQFHPLQLSVCSFHVSGPRGPLGLPFSPSQNSFLSMFLGPYPKTFAEDTISNFLKVIKNKAVLFFLSYKRTALRFENTKG